MPGQKGLTIQTPKWYLNGLEPFRLQVTSENWTFLVFKWSICVRKSNGPVLKWLAIMLPFKNRTKLPDF
jgi:hypothetical protein